jgi:hypothetical protein
MTHAVGAAISGGIGAVFSGLGTEVQAKLADLDTSALTDAMVTAMTTLVGKVIVGAQTKVRQGDVTAGGNALVP